MKITVICVTPQIAAKFLAGNTINRKIRRTHVTKLAGAMARGEWTLTHQGIAISPSGDLIDGQHRLLAIVESGRTVQMMVAQDVPVDSFKVVDKGISRTNGDSTGLGKMHVEILTFFCIAMGVRAPTSDQVLAMNGAIGSHIIALHEYCNSAAKMTSRVGVKSAAVLHSICGNRDYAFSLYRDLVLDRIDALPPVAIEFTRQRLKNTVVSAASGGGASQQIVFTKCVAMFDPKNRASKRLLYTDEKRDGAIEKIRALLGADLLK